MVDQQAKTSLSLEPTSFKISFSNFKPSINKYILEKWQTSWNNSIGNKLIDIKPTIGEYQSFVQNIRKEEVVLSTPLRSYKSQSFILTIRRRAATMCWLRRTIHCTSFPFGMWRLCTSKKQFAFMLIT